MADKFLNEYERVLNETALQLPLAMSSTQLHHATYSDIKKTSFLPSDVVEEARKDIWKLGKVIEKNAYTRLNISKCSIRLNKRWFRYVNTKRGNPCFKITYSPKKSLAIPLKLDNQFARFQKYLSEGWTFQNISLLKDKRISVCMEKEFPKDESGKRFIVGVDIGSATLATVTLFDSVENKVVKQLYFGRDLAKRQRRYLERRAKLESLADKGSHRARQSLVEMKNKQANFVKTRSGQIVKQIIDFAKRHDAEIAIENLKNLRAERGRIHKTGRKKINRIPYGQFKQFMESNCEMFQIPLVKVDAYHTSKWCSHCGAINSGHSSKNYAIYKCKKCGMEVNSDRKASLAVAVKSLLLRNEHGLTNSCSIQINRSRVPVNALLRSDAVVDLCSVNHNLQPMECPPL